MQRIERNSPKSTFLLHAITNQTKPSKTTMQNAEIVLNQVIAQVNHMQSLATQDNTPAYVAINNLQVRTTKAKDE
jgi:hypothetical protein